MVKNATPRKILFLEKIQELYQVKYRIKKVKIN